MDNRIIDFVTLLSAWLIIWFIVDQVCYLLVGGTSFLFVMLHALLLLSYVNGCCNRIDYVNTIMHMSARARACTHTHTHTN